MYSTTVTADISASRSRVYGALVDPDAVARWRVPNGMSAIVHQFEPRVGGRIRISLTYEQPAGAGKSSARTDTYHGRFVELVPEEKVVEIVEFETDDELMRGELMMTTKLTDSEHGTTVTIVIDNVPDAIPASDNETGTRMALANLAAFLGVGDQP